MRRRYSKYDDEVRRRAKRAGMLPPLIYETPEQMLHEQIQRRKGGIRKGKDPQGGGAGLNHKSPTNIC